MAVPQRDDPNVPRRDIVTPERVNTRGGWSWWWAWAIILGLAVWWAGWGWGGSGGWWWGNRNGRPGVARTGNMTGAPYNVAGNNGSNAAPGNTAANGAGSSAVGTNGVTPANPSGMAANTLQPTGPGVKILDSSDKHNFIGKHFEASDVPVAKKVDDRALWVSTTNQGQPMLVVVKRNAANAARNIDQGSLIDATGTVQKAPPENQAKREFHLNDKGAARLEQEGAYIEVSQLSTPSNLARP